MKQTVECVQVLAHHLYQLFYLSEINPVMTNHFVIWYWQKVLAADHVIFQFTGAIQRNHMAKKATDDEIENAAKLWLRFSKDWCGGGGGGGLLGWRDCMLQV